MIWFGFWVTLSDGVCAYILKGYNTLQMPKGNEAIENGRPIGEIVGARLHLSIDKEFEFKYKVD